MACEVYMIVTVTCRWFGGFVVQSIKEYHTLSFLTGEKLSWNGNRVL